MCFCYTKVYAKKIPIFRYSRNRVNEDGDEVEPSFCVKENFESQLYSNFYDKRTTSNCTAGVVRCLSSPNITDK